MWHPLSEGRAEGSLITSGGVSLCCLTSVTDFFHYLGNLQLTHSAMAIANCNLLPTQRKLLSWQMCQRVSQAHSLPLSCSQRHFRSLAEHIICYHFSNLASEGLTVALAVNGTVPSPPGLDRSISQTLQQWLWKSPASKTCIGSMVVNRMGFQYGKWRSRDHLTPQVQKIAVYLSKLSTLHHCFAHLICSMTSHWGQLCISRFLISCTFNMQHMQK